MAIQSSFLLLVVPTGHRSKSLGATVAIGVRRLTTTTTAARSTSTSIATVALCSATAVTTVYRYVQSQNKSRDVTPVASHAFNLFNLFDLFPSGI